VHYTNLSRRSEDDPNDPYHKHYEHMAPFIARMMKLSIATPEKVARKIVKTINHPNPPLRVRSTPDAYFFDLLRRFLPRRLYHWILYHSLPGLKEWGKQ